MSSGRRRIVAFAIFVAVWGLYWLSNVDVPDRYKHHVYVADAWLHGRLWLSGYPAYYHDWITVNGQVHSPFAPTPAILLLPFVAIWGTDFNMTWFSMGVAGLNAMLCWVLLQRAGVDERRSAIATLVFAFGTVNWYSAIVGTTWFLSQLACELFLLLALVELFGKGRAPLIGIAYGFALMSRPNVATALPGLTLLTVDRASVRDGWRRFVDARAFRRAILLGIGLMLPLAIELGLNWARFGNPLDTGYGAASRQYTTSETQSWYAPAYIPKHFYISLFRGWEYVEEFPWLKPSPEGLSILLTSPVLLFAFAAPLRDRRVRLLWVAVAFTLAGIFPYFYQGWVQFGYRYLLDAMPYLIVLVALGLPESPTAVAITVATLSILANAIGVHWGKVLGW